MASLRILRAKTKNIGHLPTFRIFHFTIVFSSSFLFFFLLSFSFWMVFSFLCVSSFVFHFSFFLVLLLLSFSIFPFFLFSFVRTQK